MLLQLVSSESYRINVAALVKCGAGFLLFRRADGLGWQSVQGGVEVSDQSMEQALLREMNEELGVCADDVLILRRSKCWRRYRFAHDVPHRGDIHVGQEQLWFLVSLNSPSLLNLAESCGEFSAVTTVSREEIVSRFVEFKRAVVQDVLREFYDA